MESDLQCLSGCSRLEAYGSASFGKAQSNVEDDELDVLFLFPFISPPEATGR